MDRVRVQRAARVEPAPHLALAMWNTHWDAAALVVCVRGVVTGTGAGHVSRGVHTGSPFELAIGASRSLQPLALGATWVLVADESGIPAGLPSPSRTVDWPADVGGMRDALTELGVRPQATLGIAAHPDDVALLRAAGCVVLALTTLVATDELAEADYFAWDLNALDITNRPDGGIRVRVTRRA